MSYPSFLAVVIILSVMSCRFPSLPTKDVEVLTPLKAYVGPQIQFIQININTDSIHLINKQLVAGKLKKQCHKKPN